MTLKLRRGLPSLRSARFVRAFEATMRAGCERGRFRVVHWSVQRDHLHLIVEASSSFELGCGMKSVGVRVVRAVQRDRSHLHVLRSPREVRRAIAYVLLNARRHAAQRGVVLGRMVARVDAASSGRWFDGWRRTDLDPERSAETPAVALARSWLLAVGWRRAGLIDVSEIPGAARATVA